MHIDTPGEGGYGEPLERDPAAVRQDVWDRRVTVLRARAQYGVVLQEPGLVVGQKATQRLREVLRAQRVGRNATGCGKHKGDGRKGATMAAPQSGLTPMDLGRYYMRRMAMRVDTEHFQEICRTVAYAIDPAHTAYNFAVHYGVTALPTPEEIWRAGTLPD